MADMIQGFIDVLYHFDGTLQAEPFFFKVVFGGFFQVRVAAEQAIGGGLGLQLHPIPFHPSLQLS